MGLRKFLDSLKTAYGSRMAQAGDGQGNLEPLARPNYVYAHTYEEDDDVIEVRYTGIRPNYGDWILISLVHPQTTIGGWRMAFWLRDGNDITAPPPIVGDNNNRNILHDSDAVLLTDSDGILLEGR